MQRPQWEGVRKCGRLEAGEKAGVAGAGNKVGEEIGARRGGQGGRRVPAVRALQATTEGWSLS